MTSNTNALTVDTSQNVDIANDLRVDRVGTDTNTALNLMTNNTNALTIDTSQNISMTNRAIVNGLMAINTNAVQNQHALTILSPSNNQYWMLLKGADDTNQWQIRSQGTNGGDLGFPVTITLDLISPPTSNLASGEAVPIPIFPPS